MQRPITFIQTLKMIVQSHLRNMYSDIMTMQRPKMYLQTLFTIVQSHFTTMQSHLRQLHSHLWNNKDQKRFNIHCL